MHFRPLDRMWEQIDIAKDDNEINHFNHLMYMGEMLTKIIVLGLVAAIEDDIDRHRYRQLYKLVRANSLGEWIEVIEEILTGPTSQHLVTYTQVERRELTERCEPNTWQFEATRLLINCLEYVSPRACFEKGTKCNKVGE